jgi:uncharacterized protein (TIGR02996 family)
LIEPVGPTYSVAADSSARLQWGVPSGFCEAPAVTQEEAFLQEIIAHPDDDTPRLIYADWLDETGDPAQAARAEFIRLQCEKEQRRRFDPDRGDGEREVQLLGKHLSAWLAEVPRITRVEWGPFNRGFISSVTFTTVGSFRKYAKVAARSAPLSQVAFRFGIPRERDRIWPRLAESQPLLHFSSVDVSRNRMTAADARAFLNSPYLVNTTALDLSHNELGRESGWNVNWASRLPNLHWLDLSFNHFAERNVEYLLNTAQLPNLHTLRLWGNRLGSEAATALATAPTAGPLRLLDLRNNSLTPEGVARLVSSSRLRQLVCLHLAANGLEDRGVLALIEWLRLPELKYLNLSGNNIGDAGAVALAEAPKLESLAALRLHGNSFEADATAALLHRFGARVYL